MRPIDRRFPILGFLLLPLVICEMLGGSPRSAEAQATKPNRPEPRLPGAVEKAPDWLKDAPFDVAKFFEMPPASENAAPLYLEALFEFGTLLEPIYPPEVRQRSAAIKQRVKQADDVYEKWIEDPTQVDRKSIDAVLAEYKDGFRKLDLAQKRPKCVFATGLSYETLLPHAQESRTVTRVLLMRASRSLDRDAIDSAIDDFNRLFRLSRDLRPRGAAITQLVSIASDESVCNKGIKSALANHKLKAEHCDRLIKLLTDHEAHAIDPFPEGVKGEYFVVRLLLRKFGEGVVTTFDSQGRSIDTKLNRLDLIRELDSFLREAHPKDRLRSDQELGELLDQFGRETAKDRNALDQWARLLVIPNRNYRERARVLDSLFLTYIKPDGLTLFELVMSELDLHLLSCGREQAYLGSAKCLIALRRWQLTHNAPPTDLAEVCRAAKISGVPVDPFSGSGSPLKLVMIDGEPVVYSVGPDGVDDGGLKDSNMGRNPEGDLLFRLPKRK